MVYSSASACDSDVAVNSPGSKRQSHKQNQCSASDSVGLIFTRSYHSTHLIKTSTMTPSLLKTSLKPCGPQLSFQSDELLHVVKLIFKNVGLQTKLSFTLYYLFV